MEFAGTTMPSDSVIIVAIGVVRESGTSEPLVSIAPSITSPVIISWYGSPEDFETSWESPSVPPAPSTLKTSIPSSSLESPRRVLERARGRVPAAARGRRGHDRELAGGVRLRGVIAPGGTAGGDDRHHRGDRQHPADENARPLHKSPRTRLAQVPDPAGRGRYDLERELHALGRDAIAGASDEQAAGARPADVDADELGVERREQVARAPVAIGLVSPLANFSAAFCNGAS